MPRETLQDIISSFSPEKLITFFRRKSNSFRQAREEYTDVSRDQFRDVVKIGEIKFADDSESRMIVVTARAVKELSEKSGKKAQYDLGKKILTGFYDAGIFVFYDKNGAFRFSLIYPQYVGRRKQWSNFRRFTYFADPTFANKTFINQIADGDFSTLDKVKESFSLAKVTNDFYNDFKGRFEKLCEAVKVSHGKLDTGEVRDFTLLFVIRVIFIGFIQKRGWIGDDEKFLSNFLVEYTKKGFGRDLFYSKWLEPLFFEALNSKPGTKVAYRVNEFPEQIEQALQMAPYLNGGLFERRDMDGKSWIITDAAIRDFFDFLFAYNFTIEENTLYDEELELNPEFLGIIFERLVNKENGAVYTPRTEVDFMCRMALVKWLEKNNTTKIALKDVYELFFREGGPHALDDHQRRGDFTAAQKKDLIDLLETVTICDPSAGSGAFLVGMLHVLDEVEQCLRDRVRDADYKKDAFSRKQRVINRSLYGVEVKGWAVWITQLRLWITLFIDAPEDMRVSFEPILPSLDFKVRQGDSLVQRIGKKVFPVTGHADIPASVKAKVTRLKELKTEFFQNKHKDSWEVKQAEYRVFRDILSAEIEEKKKILRNLGDKPNDQIDLFGDDQKERQQNLDLFKERIEVLKLEINELQEEMNALSEDRPLVWNIEFAEIFFEKGGFDIIIGNPPYIRQEVIADPQGRIKDAKEYKSTLAEMVQADFTREFRKEKINAQSDLYAYFYIRSLRLLNEKGVHVFICSNSWLDAGYGAWLQKFFLNYAPVHFIFDNHAKRSFAAADVNTIISVIGAPMKKVARDHMVKFIAFKLPFEEVVFTENLLEIERARAVEANEKFRVYAITNEDLIKSGLEVDEDTPEIATAAKYIGEKWGGKFLRAPDIFFEILKRGQPYLKRFRKFFDGERYLNTGGADGFFILTNVEITNRDASIYNDKSLPIKGDNPFDGKIERKYLVPLIKDIDKENKKIELLEADAWCVVIKDPEKNEKIFDYIQWGEKQGYNKRSVTISQKPWYKPTIQMLSGGEILLPRSFGDTFLVYYNPKHFLSLRFYRLHLKDGNHSDQMVAFLNSTLFWFFYETLGQKNLGGGAMDFFMEDFLNMKIPVILDASMALLLDKMKERKIGNIFEECGLKQEGIIRDQEPCPISDRKKLDDFIFNAIGLKVNERKEVYWSVCELVKNRLDKAGSV